MHRLYANIVLFLNKRLENLKILLSAEALENNTPWTPTDNYR